MHEHCFQRLLNERNVSIINCFHLLHLFANNIALFKTFASIKLLSPCTQSSRLSVYSPLLKDFERRMQRREWRTRHLHNASKAHHKILARTIACVNNLALPWMKIKGVGCVNHTSSNYIPRNVSHGTLSPTSSLDVSKRCNAEDSKLFGRFPELKVFCPTGCFRDLRWIPVLAGPPESTAQTIGPRPWVMAPWSKSNLKFCQKWSCW